MGNILERPEKTKPMAMAEEDKAKIISFHIKSDIQYRYAKTVVTSTVVNTAKKSKEVFFYIILPESAFICEFQMEIEGKVYKAHVKEKEEAKVEYDEAVSAGKTAGHVEYTVRDSNKFTVSVNVEKEKEVIFKLTYEELLKRELSAYKHFINIDPGQLVPDLKVEVSILEACSISVLEVPPLREVNEVELKLTESVDPFVKIDRPGPNKATVYWAPTPEEQKKLNKNGVKGQLIVRYDVDRLSKPEEILINNGYFVHFFAPSDIVPLRKHVTFVLDVSGSMSGRKIEQLIAAMRTILGDMNPEDFFSLVIFSDYFYVWDSYATKYLTNLWMRDPDQELVNTVVVPAIPDNIKKAKTFVKSLCSCSSTELYKALKKSIEIIRLGKTLNANAGEQLPEPMIIFLTDGQATGAISDPEEIVTEITSQNTETSAAIFSLGFGRNADMNFLKKLSSRNSGFARKIYEASDAALQLKNFYSQIASPLLSNVKFNYQDDKVDISSVTRTSFPTLFQGSEFVVVGQLHGNNIGGELTSYSRNGCCTRPIVQSVVLSEETSFMERMWAYLTIQQLLDSVTADSGDQSAENKKKALELALKYSFVTSLTSLVVVKPDNKTSSASTERADEPSRKMFHDAAYACGTIPIGPGYKSAGFRFPSLAVSDKFSSSRQRKQRSYLESPIPISNQHSGMISHRPCSAPYGKMISRRLCSAADIKDIRAYKLYDSGSDDESEDEDGVIISKANGLVLSSIEFASSIQYQHATTEIILSVTNPTSGRLQGEFYIPLSDDAVITSCVLESVNQTVIAEGKLNSERATKLELYRSNGVLVSRQKGEEMKISVRLKGNEDITVKVVYEKMLNWMGQHYQFVLNTNIHHVLKKMVSTTHIEECYKIVDVKGFFEDTSELPDIELPTANKGIVSWVADEEKQKQMKRLHSSHSFYITYGVDRNSVSEYIVTPRGYPLHRHLTKASQCDDVHWIVVISPLLKDVGISLLDEISNGTSTIITTQTETVVYDSQDRNSAKSFVSNLQVNEECDIHNALMKALEISTTKTGLTKNVVIVLDGEKVDSVVVNYITSANKQTSVAIFCLAFDEYKNIDHAKNLAYGNSGITRVLYKECPLTVQITDFLHQVQVYLANPAPFKYIEDESKLDDFWRKSCILFETSEPKLTQLALEASIVTPATSLLGLEKQII